MKIIKLFTPIYYSHGDNIAIPISGFSYSTHSEAYFIYENWKREFNDTNEYEWDMLQTICYLIDND